jgi:hypothetical protein
MGTKIEGTFAGTRVNVRDGWLFLMDNNEVVTGWTTRPEGFPSLRGQERVECRPPGMRASRVQWRVKMCAKGLRVCGYHACARFYDNPEVEDVTGSCPFRGLRSGLLNQTRMADASGHDPAPGSGFDPATDLEPSKPQKSMWRDIWR